MQHSWSHFFVSESNNLKLLYVNALVINTGSRPKVAQRAQWTTIKTHFMKSLTHSNAQVLVHMDPFLRWYWIILTALLAVGIRVNQRETLHSVRTWIMKNTDSKHTRTTLRGCLTCKSGSQRLLQADLMQVGGKPWLTFGSIIKQLRLLFYLCIYQQKPFHIIQNRNSEGLYFLFIFGVNYACPLANFVWHTLR